MVRFFLVLSLSIYQICGADNLRILGEGGGRVFAVIKGLFWCWCGCCVRAAAVVRNDEVGTVVVVIERVGLVDDKLLKSFVLLLIEVIVIGRDDRWCLPILVSVRNFTPDEGFDPVLVPLTARVGGGIESTPVEVVVFERLIIDWSLFVKRSILIGGRRVFGSVCRVVAER